MVIQKMCGHLCRIISRVLGLSSSGGSWGGNANKNGAKCEWTYFSFFGPATLIVRDGQSRSLMGLFAVKVEYDSIDQSGRVLSCRLVVKDRQKNDQVIIGSLRVARAYYELKRSDYSTKDPAVGMVG